MNKNWRIKGRLITQPDKGLAYFAPFSFDLAYYYAWFVGKENGFTLKPPRIGPHVTLVNTRFDKKTKLNKKTWASMNRRRMSFDFDPTAIRLQRAKSGHMGVYASLKTNDSIKKIRFALGAKCDKNFNPHWTIANTKSLGGLHSFCWRGANYASFSLDED